MEALLKSSDAILLVASSSATPLDRTSPPFTPINLMVRAAHAGMLPLFDIQFPSVHMPLAQSSAWVAPVPPNAIYSLDIEAPDWSATMLGLDVAKTSRSSLIVTGYWLEEAVTFLVLRALSHSYKIYVVLDATLAEDGMAGDTARQRLVFAGAVPTTTHQILRELAATSSDPLRRQALQALRGD